MVWKFRGVTNTGIGIMKIVLNGIAMIVAVVKTKG